MLLGELGRGNHLIGLEGLVVAVIELPKIISTTMLGNVCDFPFFQLRSAMGAVLPTLLEASFEAIHLEVLNVPRVPVGDVRITILRELLVVLLL